MSDGLLLTSVFHNNKVTDEGVFEVTVNGNRVSTTGMGPGRVFLTLPDTPRPLPIKVILRSKPKHHFDAEGEYEYQGRGNLVIKKALPEFFQPPRAVFVSSLPGTTRSNFFNVILTGYLSRVRDTTPVVLAELA